MRINHNISAINANRQLSSNQGATSKSLEKLSSGLRINTSGDDAAGLAISEKMRSQIRGLAKAQSNAQDSISLIQTAEGALQQVSDILQRMRELSVQSMNGILSDTEKDSISSEMTQLRQEVDRIAETSKFNNTYLLKGTLGLATDTTNSTIYTTTSASSQAELMEGIKSVDVAAAEKNTTYSITLGTVTSYTVCNSGDAGALKVVSGATTVAGQVSAADAGVEAGKYVQATEVKALYVKYTAIDGDEVTAISKVNVTNTTYSGFISFTDSSDVDSGIKLQVENMNLNSLSGKAVVTSDAGTTNLQIGANSVDTPLKIEIPDLRALALGIDELNINTTADAKETLDKIDNALTTLNSARGNLGAYQNRLEYTLNSLAASEENLTAAESRIRDVDMAKEMVTYTQASILNQSATAMLSQANQLPQQVLQLLQGL